MRIYVVLIESTLEPGHFETERAFVTRELAEHWLQQQEAKITKADPNEWENPQGETFRLESIGLYNK